MELTEVIKYRRSIRGYKPTPVPRETLTEILELAIRAPSNLNIQPWEFTVLGGKVLDNVKQALQEQFLAGTEFHPDFPIKTPTGIYRERQVELGVNLYQLMDIAKEDKEKKNQWLLKMLRFFDAPNAIIVSMDEEASSFWSMFSVGALSQTIALAATNFSLGTCIERETVGYPEVIRGITGIADSKKLAIGVAIGYPDWDFPANRLQSKREPSANITTWLGV